MTADPFESLRARVADIRVSAPVGRVASLSAEGFTVSGLSTVAHLGDELRYGEGEARRAEIVEIEPERLRAVPLGGVEDVRLGVTVRHAGAPSIAPGDHWIGRIVDPFGQPLDGRPLTPGRPRPVSAAPPPPVRRRPLGARLHTGYAVLDTMLPLVRGQRIGLFAGSGVGKSTLLGGLARGVEADVCVLALVGERGREVGAFARDVLGPEGMARTVIVAATSEMSAAARRRCALSAMAVAEHFRDAGRHVLFLCDSVARLAEAHREVCVSAGEPLAGTGHPASLTPLLASLAERAGPGADGPGDVTAVFSVLVAGSDMEEPVADILRGQLDGHVVLSRDIAERGRFPAVDVLRSVSRALPAAATEEENALLAEARRVLDLRDSSAMMIDSGLYEAGANPALDRAVALFPRLDAAFARSGLPSVADAFGEVGGAMGMDVAGG